MSKKIRVCIIGASGYTGGDLARLAVAHPHIEITSLVAKTHAGKAMADIFPHLIFADLPEVTDIDAVEWSAVDAVFCGLPHGTAQDIIRTLPDHVKIIDMSADFRLRDAQTYSKWYGRSHDAADLLKGAVYGLSEYYRDDIKAARLVACPGCYPTATLLSLLPLVENKLIASDDIIIDAKSGVSGAGRALKQNTLFTEAGEGLSPYGVASHRHSPEIEQEITAFNGLPITVNFTPHLIPMSRGELVTSYVRLKQGKSVEDLRSALEQRYQDEPFVHILPQDKLPATQHVRGSNYCLIGVYPDRIARRAIVIGAIDNLVKGSAGQALQNFNIMHGFEETAGLKQMPLFP